MKPVRLFILLLPLLAVACATRPPAPDQELAVARSALGSAQDAGARQHAAADFRQARQKLEQAEAAHARGEFERARRLAVEAETDARYAAFRARAESTEAAIIELEESIADLRAEIERSMDDDERGGGR